jgi:hypothetical protein
MAVSHGRYEALTGEFYALDTIVERLGHAQRPRLALLALDCEGCECVPPLSTPSPRI